MTPSRCCAACGAPRGRPARTSMRRVVRRSPARRWLMSVSTAWRAPTVTCARRGGSGCGARESWTLRRTASGIWSSAPRSPASNRGSLPEPRGRGGGRGSGASWKGVNGGRGERLETSRIERPASVGELTETLRQGGYLADRGLATALFVSLSLQRPILLEGEVGVGKTELAKALAAVYGRRLIRLQCYEGIDTSQALYEWDYARQMLHIRALSEHQVADPDSVDKLFGPKFLLERPLLEAVRAGEDAVLLIDEIDRADDEFEAFLLEVLSDFQISIPEIGTITADSAPAVILTSNRTRELHDALRRRCLYHWIGYPSQEREAEIVLVREPGAAEQLTRKVVRAVHRLRELDLAKPPGVAETIDWVRTLGFLGETELTPEAADDTLGAVIKDRDDLDLVRDSLEEITSGA